MTVDNLRNLSPQWQPEITVNPDAEHRLRTLWEEYGDPDKFRYENTYQSLPETMAMWQATADAVPPFPSGALVVDMGIGPGFMTQEAIKKSPGIRVKGLDISLGFLQQAQKNLSKIPEARGLVEL